MWQRFAAAEVGEDDPAVREPCFGAVCAAEVGKPVLVGPVRVHQEEFAVAVDVGGVDECVCRRGDQAPG